MGEEPDPELNRRVGTAALAISSQMLREGVELIPSNDIDGVWVNPRRSELFEDMDPGHSVEDLIVGLLQDKFPAEAGMSQEEEDKVKERLKALGYMD